MRTYLAAEMTGAGRHPAAWRLPDAKPERLFAADYWLELAHLAEGAGLDFLAIGDTFLPPVEGGEGVVRGRLDAVAIAARVAPLTSTVGLVPTATVTHTEPFHLSKAIATLDFISLGRAGWAPDVSRTQAEADLFGRKDSAPAETLWREVAEAVEVVIRLWDSWEDDAVIRDQATGRYIDRDKLHYVDFAGEFFSVKGPSITPRSPQAHPPVVLRADEPASLPVVGRWADVARIAAPDLDSAAAARGLVREAVAGAGRDPDSVAVLLDVETLIAASADAATRILDRLDSWAASSETAKGCRLAGAPSRTTRPTGTDPGTADMPAEARAPGNPDVCAGADAPSAGNAPCAWPPGTARVIGPAEGLADLMSEAVREGAVDGVTVIPLALPGGLRAVASELVPLLVARGLRPAVPVAGTLQERFRLSRPDNYYARKEVRG
jgi:alkanesulfonate monooxygenase SsuD/methylene tetrahydromethanopterin reductase-like flavin-dependent oxidoreductase (luciferase family)